MTDSSSRRPASHPATLLRAEHLWPHKGLGQNFLADLNYAQQIVAAAGIGAEDPVVEIGPGLGSLTLLLHAQATRLWCIEQDARLIPLLRQQLAQLAQPDHTWEILHADALQFDFGALARTAGAPLHIVANLPYNISTPLLLRLLEQLDVVGQGPAVRSMTLMFQQEVADRILAPPDCKSYGTLSVFCQMRCVATRQLTVPPEAFHPVPKVVSTVVRLVPRPELLYPVADEAWFHTVVRAAFGQRRKTLRNAMSGLAGHAQAAGWLLSAGIDPNRRGETLTLEEFAHLAATPLPAV
jgi:16S rRNA (adenine1518-N6/adenine1519-N6)-dimethyltransferase